MKRRWAIMTDIRGKLIRYAFSILLFSKIKVPDESHEVQHEHIRLNRDKSLVMFVMALISITIQNNH